MLRARKLRVALVILTFVFGLLGLWAFWLEPAWLTTHRFVLHIPNGNHDWWYDGARIKKSLEGAGIIVLENKAHPMQYQGQPFWIVGIADLWTRKPDIEGSLRQVESNEPVILITHNPDIFPDVPSRVSLTLAGHTHGGQVNLPVVGRLVVPSKYGQRYALGHVVENGRHLFVGGGVGSSSLPVRFRVPPEVVVLELQ